MRFWSRNLFIADGSLIWLPMFREEQSPIPQLGAANRHLILSAFMTHTPRPRPAKRAQRPQLIEQFLVGLPITCVLAPVAFTSKYIKRAKKVGHCIVCWDPFIIVRKGSQYCSDQQKANRDSNTKTFRI